MTREKNTCDECGSPYYKDSSEMRYLCPNCSHHLYGYPNCEHHFENGNCIHCGWNGQSSDYLNQKKQNEP